MNIKDVPIVDQHTINLIWNKVMLAWCLFGKEAVIAHCDSLPDNPVAQDMSIRVELMDSPYFIRDARHKIPTNADICR